MGSFLFFVLTLVVVGGLLFLGASLLLGRGETRPPADLDRSPVELPDGRPVEGDDVRALRISVAVRGYRMTEVDWLVDQLARALDERDAELARLREAARLPGGAHADRTGDRDAAVRGGAHATGTDDEVPTGPGGEGEECPGA